MKRKAANELSYDISNDTRPSSMLQCMGKEGWLDVAQYYLYTSRMQDEDDFFFFHNDSDDGDESDNDDGVQEEQDREEDGLRPKSSDTYQSIHRSQMLLWNEDRKSRLAMIDKTQQIDVLMIKFRTAIQEALNHCPRYDINHERWKYVKKIRNQLNQQHTELQTLMDEAAQHHETCTIDIAQRIALYVQAFTQKYQHLQVNDDEEDNDNDDTDSAASPSGDLRQLALAAVANAENLDAFPWDITANTNETEE